MIGKRSRGYRSVTIGHQGIASDSAQRHVTSGPSATAPSAADAAHEAMGGSDGRGSVIHPALPDAASVLLSTPLDPSSPTPLYHQIYVLLRAKILDQRFGDGDLLPSEAELASSFAVSRITAKRALDEVAAAGLAVRRRGRGTIVTHAGEVPPVQASMDGLMENLLQMGLNTDVRLITFDYVSVPVELSSIFKPHSVGDKFPKTLML